VQLSKARVWPLDPSYLAKTGRIITYRLNADYGWKGKVKNLNATRFAVIEGGKEPRVKQDKAR